MSLNQIVHKGIIIMVSITALFSCAKLPDNSQREVSHAITDGESTTMGKAFEALLQEHPEHTGVFLLRSGVDAFVARAVLASLAERSIDVQYYMFHQDTVGRLLVRELLKAADRGVRVRMLIDDMYGEEADDVWSALDTHPNMEVRLYNPFVRGRSKNAQYIFDVKRVNYRMHSKTYTVDNQVSIVGGRNIGDEYFDADEDVAFSDLDAMSIGPVVPEVSEEFDQYWNNRHSYPIATLIAGVESKAVKPGALDNLRKDLDDFYQQEQTLKYRDAMKNSAFANSLRDKTARFSFGKAKIIHDSADKINKSNEDGKKNC